MHFEFVICNRMVLVMVVEGSYDGNLTGISRLFL